MPQSLIKINGVIGSDDDLPINTLVQLDNQNIGGEVTYLWQILDQPAGPADTLSSSMIQNPTFTPKKEGTYLIRLTVNQGLPSEDIDTAIAAVRQLKTRERVPAAGETVEDNTTRGWADDTNVFFQTLNDLIADPGTMVGVNATGGTLARGTVVRVTSAQTIKSGLPGQEDLPGFTTAPATTGTALDELLMVVEQGVDGSDPVSAGGLTIARWLGRIAALPIGAGVVGDPIYVTDAAGLGTSPGTNIRQVGSIAAVSGANRDVWFAGSQGGNQAPVDRAYVVYGNPGPLSNALRVDGLLATGIDNNIPVTFKGGDLLTIPVVIKRFNASATANLLEIQDETATIMARFDKDGELLVPAFAIGDADFVLRLNGTDAEIHGDLPDAEPLFYDRTDNQWRFNSEVGIGDDDFKLLHTSPGASSSPTLQFDSGDFFRYRRNINLFDFLIASVNKMSIGPEGVIIDNGLVVGFSVAPVDDAVLVADADFGLFGGSSPALKFDTGTGVGDTLNYQRSADRFQFKIAGASVVQIELAIPLHLFPDPTSPLRGAVKFETQDTDPSAPSAHELFVHDDTDQLSWYDSRRQQAISAFVYELLQTSNALDDTPAGGTDQLFDFGGGPTDIKYPIPGITLRAGTVIRIVAGGAFSVGVADSLTFKVKIGGVSGAEVFDRGISLPVSSGDFYLEVSVTIRSLGAGTGVAYGTGMIAMTYGANDTVRARLRGNVAVTTTTLQDLVVTAAWGLQGNGNNVTMAVHNVEVQ